MVDLRVDSFRLPAFARSPSLKPLEYRFLLSGIVCQSRIHQAGTLPRRSPRPWWERGLRSPRNAGPKRSFATLVPPGAWWIRPRGAAFLKDSRTASCAAIRNASASWRGHGQKSRLARTDAPTPAPLPPGAADLAEKPPLPHPSRRPQAAPLTDSSLLHRVGQSDKETRNEFHVSRRLSGYHGILSM